MLLKSRERKGSGLTISEQMSKTPVTLLAGIDAGSTETRVCLADRQDVQVVSDPERVKEALSLLKATYKIPSTYSTLDNAKEIVSVSDNLEDNYDTTLICVKNSAEKPLMGKHRILRGRKTQDTMGLVSRYLDSSTNKTDNLIFYINVIDSLGYAIMQKYNGQIPAEVDVYLTLSVRPKELTTICKKMMKENLVGSFMFNWRSVSISINIVDLNYTTEPQAQIQGTMAVYDLRSASDSEAKEYAELADLFYYSSCFVHIEGGGSSIGVEVLRNGDIIDACSTTFPLGGNYLAQVFIDTYREVSGRTITKNAANQAIISGILRDGRNQVDVSQMVAECKDKLAMDIVERLRHEVIDTSSELMLQDVEFITLGGRLFLPDQCNCKVGEYFGEYIHQISPNTEIIVLSENFIAQGNLVSGIRGEFVERLGIPQVDSEGNVIFTESDGDLNFDTPDSSTQDLDA